MPNLLWVDKHRPKCFDALTYHDDLTERLRGLCAEGDLPHLLLYGPSGAGKRTRVACVLRELFGPNAEKRRVAHKVFRVGDNKKELEVTTVTSSHHIEVNPSDVGINDRLVVQELIKDMASLAPIDFSGTKRKSLKVIVLHEVDRMSRLAQQALRRTIERYARTCRMIMVCESATRVIEPLRSRCLGIRVALPNRDSVISVLRDVAARERVELPDTLADQIVATSGRNLRRAILQLEATRVACGSTQLRADAQVMRGDWEYVCNDIAVMVSRSQSATQLVGIRKKLQELIAHAVPPDTILRRVVEDFLRIADDEIGAEICNVAAKFDHSLSIGTKPIFHLEAFIARLMQIYNAFLHSRAAMMD